MKKSIMLLLLLILVSASYASIGTYSVNSVRKLDGQVFFETHNICNDGGVVYFSSVCNKGYNNYKLSSTINYLTSSSCNFIYNSGKISLNWHSGNIETSTWILGTYDEFLSSLTESVKESYFYPRINLKIYLEFSNQIINESLYNNLLITKNGFQVNSISNYDSLISSFEALAQNRCNNDVNACGNYEIKVSIESNDLKCDFNSNGLIDSTEILNFPSIISSFTVLPPPGPTINFYNSANQQITEGLTNSTFNFYASVLNADSCTFVLDGGQASPLTDISNNIPISIPVSSSQPMRNIAITCTNNYGTTSNSIFVYLDSDNDGIKNIQDSCPNHANFNTDEDGDGIDDACDSNNPDVENIETRRYFKFLSYYSGDNSARNILFNEETGILTYIGSDPNMRVFYDTRLLEPASSTFNLYSYITNPVIGTNYDVAYSTKGSNWKSKGGVTVQYIEEIQTNDNTNLNKVVCNEDECMYSNTNEIITLPESNKNNIKIYKEGVLIREESPNPQVIAMKGHAIQKFKSKEDAEEFVNKSVRLMEKFNISKYITYNQTSDTSTIKIDLNNIPLSEQKDLTLYQIIPKEFANKLSEIKLNSNNGQFIVLDKDPVIGWYFNDSQENEEVEYTIPGNNEGGTIIITQEPILFNEGELIINYRESGCNADELELFQLDDLENSNIYESGTDPSRLYKVCLAHINDTISESLILGDSGTNNMHIFNYTDEGNMSLNKYLNSLDVSLNNNNIYWNIQFEQNNPDGTFSCLGSYTNQESSTFGDCGYTNNRIWLHLGADMMPPETKITYPYLAHTMRIKFEASDNFGSGVNRTYYCIGEGCTPQLYNNEEVYLDCSNDWGCVKTIRYYSIDNANNSEPLKEYKLTLIEQGSACQSDCTAKPTPNRIIKDCMNLNGCTFYGNNQQEKMKIAESCHYLTADTWVNYNLSHEVLCPNGPVRKAQFTATPINFWESICDNLQQATYPVLIDGKQVNMVFVYCEEY